MTVSILFTITANFFPQIKESLLGLFVFLVKSFHDVLAQPSAFSSRHPSKVESLEDRIVTCPRFLSLKFRKMLYNYR